MQKSDVPGENGSRRGSAGCCGAKCTRWVHAAPGGGLRRRHCGVGAGLESEGGHLVLLVADAQREVVQGAANDSVWAVEKLIQFSSIKLMHSFHFRQLPLSFANT